MLIYIGTLITLVSSAFDFHQINVELFSQIKYLGLEMELPPPPIQDPLIMLTNFARDLHLLSVELPFGYCS
jgi:hypothetical protein